MKKFDSKKVYLLEEKKVATSGLKQVINTTKQKIVDYYDQPISFDDLITKYRKLEYKEKHEYNFLSGLLIGILGGVIGTSYDKIMASNTLGNLMFGLVFILIIVIVTIKGLQPSFLETSTKIYTLFIVPFEKQIIIKKLKKDFNFSLYCNEKETRTRVIPYRINKPHQSID